MNLKHFLASQHKMCWSPGWASQCDVFITLRIRYQPSHSILFKIKFVMVAAVETHTVRNSDFKGGWGWGYYRARVCLHEALPCQLHSSPHSEEVTANCSMGLSSYHDTAEYRSFLGVYLSICNIVASLVMALQYYRMCCAVLCPLRWKTNVEKGDNRMEGSGETDRERERAV